MPLLFYIAVILGAVGVYLTLPHGRSIARIGPLLAVAGIGLGLVAALGVIPTGDTEGSASVLELVHMGLFTIISAAAGVRVITHTRPVYSALYFVLVVLSSAGMLVMLEAEFMAFAMVIIYGGAILITYMFVIMLATLPQSEGDTETSTVYDRFAREPGMAVLMGFVLIAVIGSVVFQSNSNLPDENNAPVVIANTTYKDKATSTDAARKLVGKIKVDDVGENTQRITQLERLLRNDDLIKNNEHVFGIDLHRTPQPVAHVSTSEGAKTRDVVLDNDTLEQFVANIDRVGLNLFEGHTLGIELAGIILLLSMVGAIVIARQKVPEKSDLPD